MGDRSGVRVAIRFAPTSGKPPAASPVSDFVIRVGKAILPRVLRNYLSCDGGGIKGCGRVRRGGKNQSCRHVGLVLTHKRRVLPVSFQLSKDLSERPEDAQEFRAALLQLHPPPEPTARPPPGHARRPDARPRPAAVRRVGALRCRWVPRPAPRALEPLPAARLWAL